MERKGIVKILSTALTIILVVAMILPMSISVFQNEEETIINPIKATEQVYANKTGNTAKFSLGKKIDKVWTYKKAGQQNLNVYCAEKGASASTWNEYVYDEVQWNEEAGIWLDETSYKKITWIKNNFWEANNISDAKKYTNNEKLAILNTVDATLTIQDIENVFNNVNEKFKLYQMIVYTYTNGKNVVPAENISGNTFKVYLAINKLVNNNYNITPDIKISAEANAVWNDTAKTYTWVVDIKNTYPLPYTKSNNGQTSFELIVDGNKYTNYTYNEATKALIIKGLEDGEHTFTVKAHTYIVSSSASIWLNAKHQDFIEITNSNKVKKPVQATVSTAKTKLNGKYNIEILKVDEQQQPVAGVEFNVNNNVITTDVNGIVKVLTQDATVTKENEKYEYTITEVNTKEQFVKLKNPVKVVLTTGLRTASNKTYYSVVNAVFANNNDTILEVETEKDKVVKLALKLENNNDTTTVKLTIPNKEKIYDLALTKSIIIKADRYLDEYDIDRDGDVDALDASLFGALKNYYNEDDNAPIKTFLSQQEAIENAYNTYFKYYTEEELKQMLAADWETAWKKSLNALDVYATTQTGGDQDRIEDIYSHYVLNKNGNTTAEYILNKTPYAVEETDKIIYKITVYNEGDYDSKNITVTDYLPKGLKVCNVQTDNTSTFYYKDKEFIWTVDKQTNTATITIPNIIQAYNGKDLKYTNVYIECEIDTTMLQSGELNYDDILYNVAEITSSEALDSEGNVIPNVEDRDSEEDTIESDTHNNVIDEYTDKFEEVEKDNSASYIEKSKYNYEDDDDFERIIIVENKKRFDLSLRKSITKIGTSEATMSDVTAEYTKLYEEDDDTNKIGNRLPVIKEISSQICKIEDAGIYFHPKHYVAVRTGDFVEYTIRVYNEGGVSDYAGYASQITDYLPNGLEFYAVVNNDGKWITSSENGVYKTTVDDCYGGYEVQYDKDNNKVVLDYKGSLVLRTKDYLYNIFEAYKNNTDMFGYYNYTEDNYEKYFYQEVKVICKVTSTEDYKKLTNVAEITGYVAANLDGTKIDGIQDKDSSSNITIKETTNMEENEINLDTYYDDREIDEYTDYSAGCEDDDDFETVLVKTISGRYNLVIKKINSITQEVIDGATFKVNGVETMPTSNGVVNAIEKRYNNTTINEVDEYTITEVKVDSDTEYLKIKEPITVYVKKAIQINQNSKEDECVLSLVSFDKDKIVNAKTIELEDGSKADIKLDVNNNTITLTIPNKPTGFDLSLRKFITAVNGKKLEGKDSREPQVDTSKLVSGESTTAEYKHTKEPLLVSPKDTVEYTIRVYNEGKLDGYAMEIMDDIPEGVEMVKPFVAEDGTANTNAKYRWKMYRKFNKDADNNQNNQLSMRMYNDIIYIETDKVEEAELIVSDYLAIYNGKEENLLKAFDYEKGVFTNENYRDIKVEFKVKPTNEEGVIITNYAQITDDNDAQGNPVTDRDSTPNIWEESPRNDDQDIEKIQVKYFDLALYKWVSSTIVTEDGKVIEYASEHTQDDKTKLVNVTIPKEKLDKTVVKFKYQIKVKNEGQLAGYAKEIKDHIPEGLKFVAEDNTEYRWVEQADGTITTDYLKDTLLNPEETAEVTVVLTWINGDNNLGEKWNFAEISEDYNDYGAPDKDSTPNNFKNDVVEDDEDKDVVMLNIKTGSMNIIYIILSVLVVTILTAGVIGIKKIMK